MAIITDLPCEAIVMILQKLDNIRSLLPCLLTCRHFYTSFKESPNVAPHIIREQVTPALIPYAVALQLLETERHSPRPPSAVRDLLEKLYADPSTFATQLWTIPRPILASIARKHTIIHLLATSFADRAWALHPNQQDSRDVSLSSTEYFRFCRAFYRVDLFFTLFSESSSSSSKRLLDEDNKHWFLSKHPPWEKEQLGAVHDFLELKLAKATHDILAHDIEFGEMSIDYLTNGTFNHYRQLWTIDKLSQGIEYIYRLMTEDSYDAKKALLKDAFSGETADLHDALIAPAEEDLDENTALVDYTDETLLATLPPSDKQDTDKGPYAAWRSAYHLWPRTGWVVLDNYYALRERAYVFWDFSRLEKHNLLGIYEDMPDGFGFEGTEEDNNEMSESFDERSKIWQHGGRGYWIKNDLSRITWSSEENKERYESQL